MAEAVAAGASIEAIGAADLRVVGAVLDASVSAVPALWMNPIAAPVRSGSALGDAIYADADADAEQSVAGWRALLAWLQAPRADAIEAIVGAMAARDGRTLRRIRRAVRAPQRSRP